MSDQEIVKHYQKGELTVVWKPKMCIHSAVCAKGLPNVFKPQEKPWVDTNGASEEDIMKQIDACPSKALTYKKG